MKRKIAYIAGPYRAGTIEEIGQNIRIAEAIAKEYWKKGYAVICPHTNSGWFDGIIDGDEFTNCYLEIVSRLDPKNEDVVVLAPGWKYSDGSKQEYNLAREMGLIVEFYGGKQ